MENFKTNNLNVPPTQELSLLYPCPIEPASNFCISIKLVKKRIPNGHRHHPQQKVFLWCFHYYRRRPAPVFLWLTECPTQAVPSFVSVVLAFADVPLHRCSSFGPSFVLVVPFYNNILTIITIQEDPQKRYRLNWIHFLKISIPFHLDPSRRLLLYPKLISPSYRWWWNVPNI